MTKSNDRKNLQDKFRDLSRELIELRKKLNIVGPEKEKWFKKKEDLKKEVFSLSYVCRCFCGDCSSRYDCTK